MGVVTEDMVDTEVMVDTVVMVVIVAMVVAMAVMVHTTDGEILNLLLANHKKLLV
jgi:hypothetical protein